jgi:hypothetical protein
MVDAILGRRVAETSKGVEAGLQAAPKEACAPGNAKG